MSSKAILATTGAIVALVVTSTVQASPPKSEGTVAITPPPGSDSDDPLTLASTKAATTAFGMRGFTLLNDPAHAAYLAEVVTTRTEVGTSVAKGATERPFATGAGVNIPISGGKAVLLPLQRTEIEIRLRERGSQNVLWHGAALTVRSEGAQNGGPDQVAFALSQAALSSYPTQATVAISVP